jgi:predicted secreted protein
MLVVNDMANATVSIYLEKKDDGITVKLETTGYSWHVLEIDDSILKAGKTEFRPQSNLLGAPGKEIMYFTALENGETKLVLGYLRPWEKGIKPLDTFSVTVRVILMLQ